MPYFTYWYHCGIPSCTDKYVTGPSVDSPTDHHENLAGDGWWRNTIRGVAVTNLKSGVAATQTGWVQSAATDPLVFPVPMKATWLDRRIMMKFMKKN